MKNKSIAQYPQRTIATRTTAVVSLFALLVAVTMAFTPAAVWAAPAAEEQPCGTPQTLTVSADAWIEQEAPSANYGSDTLLHVKTHGSVKNRTLIGFVQPVVAEGCVVESASLRLYAESWTAGRTLRAVGLAGDWSEESVTWGNQPDAIGEPALADSGSEVVWDVTSQMQAMIDAGSVYGFQIRDDLEGNAGTDRPGFEQQFYSRENGGTLAQIDISWKPAPDTTAPETTLDGGPDANTTSTDATFVFSSSEDGSSFECSLDGAEFAPCSSPVVYTGLAVGQHTFTVRAIDAAGNVDGTPASYTWTVEEPSDTSDTQEPGDTSSTQEPGDASGSQEPGDATGGQEPGDTSSGQEPGDASGNQEPGDTSGGQEPGDTSGGQEPGDTSGSQEPGDTSGGQQPGDTSGGQEPSDTSGGEEPGDTSGGQQPGDTSGGQEPGDSTGGQEPGNTSGGQEPGGDTSGGQTPGDTSGGQQPGDTSGGEEPGETPNTGQDLPQSSLFLPVIGG